jgi:hypothetical protein
MEFSDEVGLYTMTVSNTNNISSTKIVVIIKEGK